MSHTDKDLPWRVRRARGEDVNLRCSWSEKGSGEKGVRLAKRESRRARRRGIVDPRVLKSLTQTSVYSSS